MSWLQATVAPPAAFRPGEQVRGEAAWTLTEPAAELELKLCWTTDGPTGMGGEPVVVLRERFPVEGLEGRRDFSFELPPAPWSFQGALFSVRWFVELAKDDWTYQRADFVVGPDGGPVVVAPPGTPG